MEIISRYCSSNLKKLSLPRDGIVTDIGAHAMINADFAHTLQELNVSSLIFRNIDVLLEILSHLSDLRKLEICDISSENRHQILPVPLDDRSLLRLEHLCISSYDLTENISAEMSRFCQNYPCLKSLQIFQCITLQTDIATLLSLSAGLQERKGERLAYLRIETRYGYCRNIVQQMNADKITTGATIEEILFELKMDRGGGVVVLHTIWSRVSSLEEVWNESNKDYNQCRDMLEIIDLLIPKYKDIIKVLQVCAKAILFMVNDQRLRDELKLTHSKIESFLYHTRDQSDSVFRQIRQMALRF